jgi:hypothetical protein
VIGRLDDGKRTFAFILADPKTFSKLEKQELVGKTFSIEYDPESKQNRIVIKNDNFI